MLPATARRLLAAASRRPTARPLGTLCAGGQHQQQRSLSRVGAVGAATAGGLVGAMLSPASAEGGTWAWGSGLGADPPPRILPGRRDPFDGVSISPSAISPDPGTFDAQLSASLEAWRANGTRGVWLKLPIEQAQLVSVAASHGFIYHHAEAGYVMMTRWLPDCPSPLPHNASSQVGVGAVVVNDEGKVLLVQEAVGPLRGRDIWKIPTGLLDAREDICDGVVRPRDAFSFCVTQSVPCR